ncbi:unnamed protein product [Gongylonema pulchrum]|uniref:IPT/TIG domain-containing protein n=1 Tax=Gongylonema pulchrum TaxID=637853 RepID=A0A183DCS5_9BILA|nr:unnamed protein product [Gongylonema pulchrum]
MKCRCKKNAYFVAVAQSVLVHVYVRCHDFFFALYCVFRSQLCPYPVITDFSPKKGPIAGGTKLVIDGMNLGHSYKAVVNAVTAANVRCDVDESAYVTASRIVCRTRQSPLPVLARNPVIVKLRDEHRYTAISNDSYTYVDPVITNMEPSKGLYRM